MILNHRLVLLFVGISLIIIISYKISISTLCNYSTISNSSFISNRISLTSLQCNKEKHCGNTIVPNVIHYIRLNKKSWTFVEYICLLSAYVNQQPDSILIHTNVIDGFKGKYWKWIQQRFDLKSRLFILPVKIPYKIFGHKLNTNWRVHHGSDILRIQILIKYGGIYLDNDVYVVQNLNKYRKFEMTLGWPKNESLGSMILIASKNSRFLPLWLDNYHDYKADLWYYNAGDNPTTKLLLKSPDLVNRVEKRLGVNFMMRELFQSKNFSWHKEIDTVHLLINHRRYLDMFFKDYRYFNERNILHYPFIFSKMVKYVNNAIKQEGL